MYRRRSSFGVHYLYEGLRKGVYEGAYKGVLHPVSVERM